MTTTEMDLFDPDNLSEEGQEVLALQVSVNALPEIQDTATLELAWSYRKLADDLIEKIKAKWKPIKARERAVWQQSVDDEARELEGPTAVRKAINERATRFQDAQESARRKAEREAAEAARVIELANAAAEKARLDLIAKLPVGAPPPPPVDVPRPTVTMPSIPPAAKVAGLTFSMHYGFVVDDLMALVKAIAAGKVVLEAVAPVKGTLDEMARTFGPQSQAKEKTGVKVPMPGVPGVSIISERRTRG